MLGDCRYSPSLKIKLQMQSSLNSSVSRVSLAMGEERGKKVRKKTCSYQKWPSKFEISQEKSQTKCFKWQD